MEETRLEVDPNGITANKGDGVKVFVEENGLSKIYAFGDDEPDIAMARKAHLLVEAKKFIESNEKLAQDERLRSAFINKLKKVYDLDLTEEEKAELNKYYNLNLTEEEKANRSETKYKLIKELNEKLFSSTPETQLEDHALIAVRHPSDMKSGKKSKEIYLQERRENNVYDTATIKVGGVKELLGLLNAISTKIDDKSEGDGQKPSS